MPRRQLDINKALTSLQQFCFDHGTEVIRDNASDNLTYIAQECHRAQASEKLLQQNIQVSEQRVADLEASVKKLEDSIAETSELGENGVSESTPKNKTGKKPKPVEAK